MGNQEAIDSAIEVVEGLVKAGQALRSTLVGIQGLLGSISPQNGSETPQRTTSKEDGHYDKWGPYSKGDRVRIKNRKGEWKFIGRVVKDGKEWLDLVDPQGRGRSLPLDAEIRKA